MPTDPNATSQAAATTQPARRGHPHQSVHHEEHRPKRESIWTSKTLAGLIHITLTRGARVIVSGRLRQRSYETREGDKRTVTELAVDEIGPSLRYATATVRKVKRGGNTAATNDPWTSAERTDATADLAA